MFSPPPSTDTTDNSGLPILITQEMRQTAKRFSLQQPSKPHGLRIYRNTLAVSVVDRYLKMLGITTHLQGSDSWNPFLRLANDVADLVIGQGCLECRPVEKDALSCYVPLEAQCDRIAYIVVRLDSDQEATILGFVSRLNTEYFPLVDLQPISALPQHLAQQKTLVHLRRWLEGIYQQDWQPPEALLQPQQLALSNPQATAARAKLIQLNLYSEHSDAVLLLALSNAEPTGTDTVDIDSVRANLMCADLIRVRAQLYPAIAQPEVTSGVRFVPPAVDYLLPDIKLSLQSAEGTVSREVVSRAYPRDNCIQIPQFQGEPGEQFILTITAGEQHIEEHFQL